MRTHASLPRSGCPFRDRLGRWRDALSGAPRPCSGRWGEQGAVLCFPVPGDPREVGILRRKVRYVLGGLGVPGEAADDVLLAVSELVTNAVVHGMPPAVLRLAVGRGSRCLRIEVTDAGPSRNDPTANEARDEHGRGLQIVAALASGHGVTVRPDGTTYWADMAAGPPRRRNDEREPVRPVAVLGTLAAAMAVAAVAVDGLLEFFGGPESAA
ncbi:ATP-binding protein [Streptomyces sp. NPDC026673]|uniref:ATP-binding protein n=1 Tax=Streptomyces sp. NPDC026673 TaxID=3155724 RepID=UPI003402E04F